MKFNPTWVYVASFVDLFAVSLSIPLLTAHLRSLGASHILIGSCSSLYAAAQLISGPIIGSWSDQKGRQTILLISLTMCAICYTFLGIFEPLFLVLLIRVCLGIFKHTQVLTRTIIADRVLPEEQSSVSGRLAALSSAGFIVGPAIGGHLAEIENGFSYLCYCTALLFVANIVISYLFLPDPPNTLSNNENGKQQKRKKDFNLREEMMRAVYHLANVDWSMYWDIFAIKFVLSVSQTMFLSNYFINIQETFNVSPRWAGYTVSLQGLVAASVGLLAGWVDRNLYKNDPSFRQRNLHGFTVMAVSYTGLFLAPTLYIFMLWVIPLTTCSALLRIVGIDMVLTRCHPTQRGSLVGTANSIASIARLISPLLAGVMGDLYGTRSTMLLSILMSGLGIILSLTMKRYKPVSKKDE